LKALPLLGLKVITVSIWDDAKSFSCLSLVVVMTSGNNIQIQIRLTVGLLVGLRVGMGVAAGLSTASTSAGGRRTESMTWMIPLLAIISGTMTLASFTETSAPEIATSTGSPFSVSISPLDRYVLRAFAGTTWYRRMSLRRLMFSGNSRDSTVPSGRARTASLVGDVQPG